MAKTGPDVSSNNPPVLRTSPEALLELGRMWERNIGREASDAVLERIDQAIHLYIGTNAVQQSMANAPNTRRILERVKRDASDIWRLLAEPSPEAKTALARLGTRMRVDSSLILAFLSQFEEAAEHQANELSHITPTGKPGNPALEVLIHRIDAIANEAGVDTKLTYDDSKAVTEGTHDYSAAYASPYLNFLAELLAPVLPTFSLGALAGKVRRARQKDILFSK